MSKKISFCTVSMNRIEHVKETLVKNISSIENLHDIEFVLLDYNSEDNLEQWVQENLNQYIQEGILNYFRTEEPFNFHRSHSRNMAMKLAQGEILCNVDADNFVGKDFDRFLNKQFETFTNIFLSPIGVRLKTITNDVLGRLCLLQKDFSLIRGFDEGLEGYGFEDHDLVNRLKVMGLRHQPILDTEYLKAILHDDNLRISNEASYKSLFLALVHYISHCASEVLLLFDDGKFKTSIIIDNTTRYSNIINEVFKKKSFEYEFSLQHDWIIGSWNHQNDKLILKFDTPTVKTIVLEKKEGSYWVTNPFKQQEYFVLNKDHKEELLFFYSQVSNRYKMRENLAKRHTIVNKEYGKGIVYKNFNYEKPICC